MSVLSKDSVVTDCVREGKPFNRAESSCPQACGAERRVN